MVRYGSILWHGLVGHEVKVIMPIFYGPVILPYILKTIQCIYSILSEYESVWPDVWPQNNVGHCDLYFKVQWVCLIPWRLFHVWMSLFGIMTQYDLTLDLNINVGHHGIILCYVLKTIWCMNIILGDYGSVWPDVWPQNKCMSLWPIFHGPLILPYISMTIWWMNIIFLDNETVWHKLWPKNKYRSTWLIFHGLVILLNIFQDFCGCTV